jgi:type IV secretory pathway TrbD component
MTDTRPYARRVHRSLLDRELLGGVPQAGLVILVVLAVVFIYGLELYFAAVPVAVLYLVMRVLTSRDPWLIDIVLENISQKDVYLP